MTGKDFNPNQARDPHTGEWIDTPGGSLDKMFSTSDVTAWVSQKSAGITISKIEVAPEARGKGRGTEVLTKILAYADANHLAIVLTPDPMGEGGLSKAQLTAWYKRHGFVPNKGRNRDDALTGTLIRPARGTEPKGHTLRHKTFDLIETKADGEAGQFTALASVFGNVDHVGDRVMPGAFKKTLDQWRKSGDPIPVVLSHQWDNPMAHIGIADPRAVVETEKGLLVQGKLDIGDNETAKQVHKLMKRRSLKSFSFGYSIPDGGEELAKDGANNLTEIDLVEFGPTLKGANSEAQLQAVKSVLEAEVAEAPPEVEEPPEESVEAVYEQRTVAELSEPNDENLPAPEKVENVESEKSATPAKPAAKDPLKNEIDRALIDIALGR